TPSMDAPSPYVPRPMVAPMPAAPGAPPPAASPVAPPAPFTPPAPMPIRPPTAQVLPPVLPAPPDGSDKAAAKTPALPPAPPPVPSRGPSPFLFARFTGPDGTQATFYQGRPEGRSFPAPVVVGLRPGYIYRIKLDGFPGRPGLAVYPTLEVRGTLFLPPR